MTESKTPNTTDPSAPTTPEMAAMWDAHPRPELTDYAAWIAEGVEAAPEVRAFERRRSRVQRSIYGEAA